MFSASVSTTLFFKPSLSSEHINVSLCRHNSSQERFFLSWHVLWLLHPPPQIYSTLWGGLGDFGLSGWTWPSSRAAASDAFSESSCGTLASDFPVKQVQERALKKHQSSWVLFNIQISKICWRKIFVIPSLSCAAAQPLLLDTLQRHYSYFCVE